MASTNDGDGNGDNSHPPYLPPKYIASKRNQSTTTTTTQPADDGDGDNNMDVDADGDMDVDVDDDDDPGTSWFAEHKAPEKVLRFLTSKKFPLSPRNTIPSTRRRRPQQQQRQHREPSILDLGTGNGSMLALLRKKGGFKGPMVGVDYSPQSVQLARELQRLKLHSAYESGLESEEEEEEEDYEDLDAIGGASHPSSDNHTPDPDDEEHEELVAADDVGSAQAVRVSDEIRFEEWDILAPGNEEALTTASSGANRIDWFPYKTGGFDIVLDKGTFDAVSLSADVIDDDEDDDKEKEKKGDKRVQRRVCERYPRIATKLVRKGGFLVVTSCNWTEDELIRWFTARNDQDEKDGLDVWDRIEYPRFRFGGQEGQGVCTIDVDIDVVME
ncbi:S-adenosylmethionine-dependent methyltransferase [Rasamsonia emersonii CBS 393.64]|uniref:Protein-lysine N-methyltransferase EFM4 n=1 Tax=Rasamsonia emersonii (strain ATCC 16479 / CBS 393.64 / IMI 116815) TaxID=1408163 RepID=A0A0F4YIU1_RASE3|nr:S-adenosylmethionine-dependent methyltransferase [Rasamsonia emersonii CBS 393.64]KKA18124.1 S-adenosylmethionine-dependent methyltransferase [Rasamsonia emersonii CBS 393.64]